MLIHLYIYVTRMNKEAVNLIESGAEHDRDRRDKREEENNHIIFYIKIEE